MDQSPEVPQPVSSVASQPNVVTESDLAHARTLLQPNEEILWTARTDPEEFKIKAISGAALGIPIVLFMLIAVGVIVYNVIAHFSGPFAFVACAIVLVGGFMMLVSIWKVWSFAAPLVLGHAAAGKTSIYVLSNRRLFISTPGMSTPLEGWDLKRIFERS